MQRKITSDFFALATALFMILGLANYSHAQPKPELSRSPNFAGSYKDSTAMKNLYMQAVKDAQNPTPEKIYRQLVAINEYNKDLLRKDDRVLMVIWTNWDGYNQNAGKEMTMSRPVWATPAPQLKKFFENHKMDSASLKLRIEQLLGLPPYGNYNRFALVWVKPSDMYRPCHDPEISDCECELNYSTSSYTQVSEEFKAEFENIKANTWGRNYPWTSLGYTYDWGGREKENTVGLSEFIIKKDAKVMVDSVVPTFTYLK